MKYVVGLAAMLAMALMMTGAGTPAVSYFDHAKVATALAKGESLIKDPNFSVAGSHREVAGQVELHEHETDIFYVTDGEATFVTGGTMVGGKQKSPGQMLGTSIEGGEAHHLVKGDVMVIPAGTPHWFKEVPRTVSYFTVKVIR